MTDLKLIALDADDVSVVSAHLQDAILHVSEMAWLPRERRFAAVMNRFDWQSAHTAAERSAVFERRRSALRIDQVKAARIQGIDLKATDTVLSLLSVTFEPNGGEDPGGAILLTFAGPARVRLEVECVEVELKDLGAVWAAKSRPQHG